MSQQHPLPPPWQPNVSPTGLGPLLPGATGVEGPVCPALRPSSCASSSSPCRAGPSVSSLGSPPAPQAEHPSPRGFWAVLSDRPGTGRRSGHRSRLCTLRVDPRGARGVSTPSLCQDRWEWDKELKANLGLRHFPATGTAQIPQGAASPCPALLFPAGRMGSHPSQGKGYNHVQGQHTQAAHQPGQVVQDVITLALAWVWVLQQDTEAIQGIPQHHQGKEGVGDPAGGFPLVLGKEGEERSLGAALLNLSTT